jgi:cobalt/nickel transport system ATP-binding protein
MKEIVLETKNLKYTYPGHQRSILRGVNLEIEKNTLTAIVGQIGGGKSTLLRHLNGILVPQNGDVLINGKSVVENPKSTYHQEVGLLFENPDDQIFYPIVADDIAFGPRNMNLKNDIIQRRVIQAAEELEILDLLERETNNLSFGEKTLVALAGILAMRTKIILMDSPELGLDLWSKPKILDLLEKLKSDHTLVVSTNDRDMLRRSDKIILLWNGKVRGEYQNYSSFRTALSKTTNT